MTRPVVDAQIAMEIASHEALIRQTYVDSVGVKTWCIGMTNATGHTVERYIGSPATLQHCMNIYGWALTNYADGVYEAFGDFPLTKEQFAGALSFHWNTGRIRTARWVKLLKAGKMVEAELSFLSWNKPASIKGRRQKEADLIFRGKWNSDGTVTEYTKVTSSLRPVWKSAKKTNIRFELERALSNTAPIKIRAEAAQEPTRLPEVPTLSPIPEEAELPPVEGKLVVPEKETEMQIPMLPMKNILLGIMIIVVGAAILYFGMR